MRRPRRNVRTQLEWTLKEIGIITRNWIDSAQDRDYWRALVNAALNLRVLYVMELVISSVPTLPVTQKHQYFCVTKQKTKNNFGNPQIATNIPFICSILKIFKCNFKICICFLYTRKRKIYANVRFKTLF